MGYAIKPDGSRRSVTPSMALMDGEIYSEIIPPDHRQNQAKRYDETASLGGLQRDLALAEIASDQVRINKIRREISRIKFMSQGV